jgi:hypothetical protein
LLCRAQFAFLFTCSEQVSQRGACFGPALAGQLPLCLEQMPAPDIGMFLDPTPTRSLVTLKSLPDDGPRNACGAKCGGRSHELLSFRFDAIHG